MKKLESSLLNMVLVLTGSAVIMGCILAWVNSLTAAPIQQQKEKALADGIRTVMCTDALNVTETSTVDSYVIYKVADNAQQPLGAAVESTAMGFGGNLKVLVGFSADGNILGYTLLEHQETPGLGAKADVWFQQGQKGDIIGKSPAEPLTVSKDGGQIDAITASTITSRAFLKVVNNAYQAFKNESVDAQSGASTQVKTPHPLPLTLYPSPFTIAQL